MYDLTDVISSLLRWKCTSIWFVSFSLREIHNLSTFSASCRKNTELSRLQEFRRKIPFLHQLWFISHSVLLFLTSHWIRQVSEFQNNSSVSFLLHVWNKQKYEGHGGPEIEAKDSWSLNNSVWIFAPSSLIGVKVIVVDEARRAVIGRNWFVF